MRWFSCMFFVFFPVVCQTNEQKVSPLAVKISWVTNNVWVNNKGNSWLVSPGFNPELNSAFISDRTMPGCVCSHRTGETTEAALISLMTCCFWCLQVIFLIGNKCDLDAQRDVTYEEAKQFAEENGMSLFVFPAFSLYCDFHWPNCKLTSVTSLIQVCAPRYSGLIVRKLGLFATCIFYAGFANTVGSL